MAKNPYTQLHEPINNQALNLLTRSGKATKVPNKMPRFVKIMGMRFNVAYHTKIYTPTKVRLRGIVFYNHQLIVLDPDQTLPMLKETLYHEMAHVYLIHWQMRSGNQLKKLNAAQVEEFCDLFAEAHSDARLNNSK